jgi:transcriptional regulator with XRE-family HTH domain
MDRPELADFLRRRRSSLRPADVGRPDGVRRRTPGLRREEVAQLTGISTDYYVRLEQARGPHPSTQVLASLARALRLTSDERDHLYYLAGHEPPRPYSTNRHVRPGLLRLMDRLVDTPAMVLSDLHEVLVQNDFAKALMGDASGLTGREASFIWRWFALPSSRAVAPEEDWPRHSREAVANLRATAGRRPSDPEVQSLVADLRATSEEFAALWAEHAVAVRRADRKRIVHPLAGVVAVECEILLTQENDQRLLVFSPQAGTDAAEKLELIRVVGLQDMAVHA